MGRRGMNLLLSCLLLLLPLLAACSGGGGTDSAIDSGSGEVIIGLTDAEGDFLRYQVDVASLQLTRSDGLVVEALPTEAAPVDFADLVEVTEFLTAATVPNGTYRHLSLTLDYSSADIVVEVSDVGQAAQAVDELGQPLTRLQVEVELDGDRPLVVAPGIPANLTLDFDLLATNRVDTLVNPPRVTVSPLLVAEVSPTAPKTHRLRGPLLTVNQERQSFTLAIRAHRRLHGDFGRLQVLTDADTNYEINSQPASGTDGLALLAATPAGTAVITLGEYQPRLHRFTAMEVYAGSSVAGGALDGVSGTVIARDGDLLTLQGGVLDRGETNVFMRQAVLVQLTDTTSVTRQLSPGQNFTIQDISVGQHLTALGNYDPDSLTLTAEHARMLVTGLSAQVAATDGELDVELVTLGGLPVTAFDFSGTGTSPTDDADPAFYQIDSGVLDLSGFAAGDPVRVRGFVTPFGSAPYDFTALSSADATGVNAALCIRWQPPSATGLSVAEDFASLTVAPADTERAQVVIAGIPLDLDPGVPVTIQPASDNGIFALVAGGPCRVFSDFGAFTAALAAELDQGAAVAAVSAGGDYNMDSTTFTARRLAVALGRP